ncbi:MAG: hypothetical protein U1E06_08345 [Tabrizicola sp.]|uniref:hypothetical protein n=1 Tax=Tabrizicola sp. TaxID=2005166 RepID=UPI002735F08E|nr:hypothetical protein [Tabrizicola sp.]MDP3263696.1 hypothetical protein [Tabrizicola sp.]MDP3647060.1 hypothetical protein [Paracoccaceae bacterium]MDZ4066853.1 hypothetical protein [Tabrizicola sp.]
MLGVINRVAIGRGTLEVTLDPVRLATAISTPAKHIDPDHLTFRAAFTLRRRGVETRLMFEGDAIPRDETLSRNIAKGHAFLDLITSGRSVQQIAGERKMSVRHVQQTVEFAFLSPEMMLQITVGGQPVSLSTAWCLRHQIPVDWTEQAMLFTAAGSAPFPNS